jgi:DNA segregation ATPase FtsK/SpoIIIE, S-DNA-T family
MLSSLRGVIREFTAREDALQTNHQAQRSALAKDRDQTLASLTAKTESEIAEVASSFDAARRQIESRSERRSNTIIQAHQKSRKRALDSISQIEGREKYRLQKRSLDAARQCETSLANAAARLDQFRQQHADSVDRFSVLEHSAREAFSGAPEFGRLLQTGRLWPEADHHSDEYRLLEQLDWLHESAAKSLRSFRQNVLLALFRILPLWFLITLTLLSYATVVFAFPNAGMHLLSPDKAAVWLATVLAVLVGAYFLGKSMGRPAALAIASDLAKARQWHQASMDLAESRFHRETSNLKISQQNTVEEMNQLWQQAVEEAERARIACPGKLEEQKNRLAEKNARKLRRTIEELERRFSEKVASIRQHSAATLADLSKEHESNLVKLENDFEPQWQALNQEWNARIQPIWDKLLASQSAAADLFRPWEDPAWQSWAPREKFEHAVRFGELEVDVERLAEVSLEKHRLRFPGPAILKAPLLLTYPDQGSLLFETTGDDHGAVATVFNGIIFRLMAVAPPGRVNFTIIDPVGLGRDFAGLMHLADYEEGLIKGRIWTQPAQIEERLGELTEHIEKVIQMYLRNEYSTIAEYNAQDETIAEKYHIVVIAGFPVNFSETAGRRLLNIAASGARCGVYTLIHWDQRHPLPHEFVPEELRLNSIRVLAGERGYTLAEADLPGTHIRLEAPPPVSFATEFLHKIGQSASGTNRVELPFFRIVPPDGNRWISDAGDEVRVPIGRTGATKLQYLSLGKGTRQHALVVGKTGSGKSTLFHVIITNIALWFSPEQVEFYLVDFKKGVEFKCYANRRLPHARVVAIESDREYGLSVLQRVDEELGRRGDLFRKAGVQELYAYRNSRPSDPLPRVLLMIDEFQEFFTDEDRVSQGASVLLDRIVRQGRAFGIHVLLGSQTLGGAYTLARSTIGQMVVRIALQCNEADACLVMEENNSAPRLLSRPGEGIYNDAAGSLEGNSPFQTAWLPDEARDSYLNEVRKLADSRFPGASGPVVFEGNAPADIAENKPLRDFIEKTPNAPPTAPRIWLGAPNSIKGPTEVVFEKQSGSNLLVVGQNQEAALTMIAVALLSLAAQHPLGTVRMVLVESTAPGSPESHFLDHIAASLQHKVIRPKRSELASVLKELSSMTSERTGDETPAEAPATFLLVLNLHEFKQLRQEDEFSFSSTGESAGNPAELFQNLVTEGPGSGVHVIASIDTHNSISRFLGRRALSEFHARVLFQMSPTDSASLIDTPDAAKLGLHRALLYNEREGSIEKFRPYARPGVDWIDFWRTSRTRSVA